MHDIDRSDLEFEPSAEPQQESAFDFDESQWDAPADEVFGETELMELAAEFIEITDEAELDQFIGGLMGKAASTLGSAIRSPLGRKLGGVLKGAARRTLPQIGSAIGGHFGGSSGARLGGQIAARAGSLFGLETEGLSHEDEAFEIAKQYVRFAGDAVKNAVAAGGDDPVMVAREAAARSARRLAPGLLPGGAGSRQAGVARSPAGPGGRPTAGTGGSGRTGRWVRRGNRIILYGV